MLKGGDLCPGRLGVLGIPHPSPIKTRAWWMNVILAIHCDLFGVNKWPFGTGQWPSIGGSKGHTGSIAVLYFDYFDFCQMFIPFFWKINMPEMIQHCRKEWINWLFEVSIPFIFHGQYLWVSFFRRGCGIFLTPLPLQLQALAGPSQGMSPGIWRPSQKWHLTLQRRKWHRNGQKEGCLMIYLCDMFDVSRIFEMLTTKNWGNAMGWNMLRPRTGTFTWTTQWNEGGAIWGWGCSKKTWTSSSFFGTLCGPGFFCLLHHTFQEIQ